MFWCIKKVSGILFLKMVPKSYEVECEASVQKSCRVPPTMLREFCYICGMCRITHGGWLICAANFSSKYLCRKFIEFKNPFFLLKNPKAESLTAMRMADESKHSLDSEQSPLKPSKIAKTSTSLDDGEGGDSDTGPETMRSNPKAQRYLVAIEYIGTRFSGSQQQPKFRTVIGTLEEAFEKFIGQPVPILCSSRTDAGVHALSNVCHVDVERVSKRKPGEVLPPHEPAVVKRAVNHFLQKTEGDLMVVDIRSVTPDFHARYKAQERTYFYRLLSGPETLSSFEKDRAWHIPEDLDIRAMLAACKVLVGHHDFSSFRATGCQAKSPVRTLDELSVVEVPPTLYFPSISEREQNCNLTLEHYQAIGFHNNANTDAHSETNGVFGLRRRHRCFVVTARARAFLYHQVRLLVGVLKAVGTGNLTVSDVERILKAKDVTAASPMAPACGLYLGHVKYNLP